MKSIYRVLMLMVVTMIVLTPAVGASSEQSSYNPTEPEIQLGVIKDLSIEDSGAVNLDSKSSQAIVRGDGLTELDAVKGKGDIIYVLDKESQDIISLHQQNGKIVAGSGSEVQLKFVESLVGKNGVADKDGFKSNIVRDDLIPKTGIDPTNSTYYAVMLVLLGGVVYAGTEYIKRNKQPNM